MAHFRNTSIHASCGSYLTPEVSQNLPCSFQEKAFPVFQSEVSNRESQTSAQTRCGAGRLPPRSHTTLSSLCRVLLTCMRKACLAASCLCLSYETRASFRKGFYITICVWYYLSQMLEIVLQSGFQATYPEPLRDTHRNPPLKANGLQHPYVCSGQGRRKHVV